MMGDSPKIKTRFSPPVLYMKETWAFKETPGSRDNAASVRAPPFVRGSYLFPSCHRPVEFTRPRGCRCALSVKARWAPQQSPRNGAERLRRKVRRPRRRGGHPAASVRAPKRDLPCHLLRPSLILPEYQRETSDSRRLEERPPSSTVVRRMSPDGLI